MPGKRSSLVPFAPGSQGSIVDTTFSQTHRQPAGNPVSRPRHPSPLDRISVWLAREDGALAVAEPVVLAAMLLMAGISADAMRAEQERGRMQGATDRAVVAATLLRAKDDRGPEGVMQDFLCAKGLKTLAVEQGAVSESCEWLRVTAPVAARMPTILMGLPGVNDVTLVTPAQASERRARIDDEIVVVLDVSGSMAIEGRMTAMRAAASEFALALFRGAEPGRVAISVVPCSTEVRLPAAILDAVPGLPSAEDPMASDLDAQGRPLVVDGAPRFYDDPNCVALQDWSNVRNLLIAPRLQPSTRRYGIEWSNSPQSTPEARFLPSDAIGFDACVHARWPVWGTQTDLGLAAGAPQFDPALRPALAALVPPSKSDSPHFGRPVAPDRPDTLRAILLLTDGADCCCHPGDPATRWNDPDLHDAATAKLCRSLRDGGGTIDAIAFQASQRGHVLMSDCASSPNHFFNSSAAEFADIFRSIGRRIQIQAPRLTQ